MDELRSVHVMSARDIAWLLACTLVENFGYRQLVTLWRFAAMIDVLRGRRATWESLQRKGFQTS